MKKAWLALFLTLFSSILYAKEPLRVCVDPDWTPYETLSSDGGFVGIGADLFALVAKRAGVVYTIVPTKDWEESIAFSKVGKCDALAFLNQTPAREEWLVFTEPYFTDPNVIITRESHEYISNLSEFWDLRIALPSGTSIEERVRQDFPHLVIIPATSEKEAFALVASGEADMTLRSLMLAVYTIKKEGWFNLKVAGEVPQYTNQFRIGLHKDHAALKETLNQGIRTLKPQEVREIANKHVAIVVEGRPDYGLVFRVLVGFGVVFGFGLLWLGVQRRTNARLAQQLEEQRKIEAALRESQEGYRALIEGAREGVVVTQSEKVMYCNPSFLELVGYTKEEVENMSIHTYLHPEDKGRAAQNHHRRIAGEEVEQRYPVRFITKQQETIWVEISGARIMWKGEPAALNFLVDITERVKKETFMRHMAQYDQLTGLPNRWLLDERLDDTLRLSRRTGDSFGVIFVDLNRFKPINDTYGHEVGDALLVAVAKRIKALLRESDTVARVGGDEYVVLLPLAARPEDALLVAQKIEKAIEKPFVLSGHSLKISCSAGVAFYPLHGKTRMELYRHADRAMYDQKHSRN